MTQKELQYQAFRAIRQKIMDINNNMSSEEIAGFTKGVCELERLISIELSIEEEIDTNN